MRDDIGEHRLLRRLEAELGDIAVFEVGILNQATSFVQCSIEPKVGAAGLGVDIIGMPDDWVVEFDGVHIESDSDAEAEEFVWAVARGASLWERPSAWVSEGPRFWSLGGVSAPGRKRWTRIGERLPWSDDIERRTPPAVRAATPDPLHMRIWGLAPQDRVQTMSARDR